MARQGWVSQPYEARRWCSCRAIGLFLSSLEARGGGSLEGSRKRHDVTDIHSLVFGRPYERRTHHVAHLRRAAARAARRARARRRAGALARAVRGAAQRARARGRDDLSSVEDSVARRQDLVAAQRRVTVVTVALRCARAMGRGPRAAAARARATARHRAVAVAVAPRGARYVCARARARARAPPPAAGGVASFAGVVCRERDRARMPLVHCVAWRVVCVRVFHPCAAAGVARRPLPAVGVHHGDAPAHRARAPLAGRRAAAAASAVACRFLPFLAPAGLPPSSWQAPSLVHGGAAAGTCQTPM